ncbi:MAG: hypothetical protein AAF961_00735 [Planctomycetota bacterium]
MKSEHRHELETNVLAKHLADWTERIKPYTNLIFASIGILLGVAIAMSLWSQRQAREDGKAWTAYEVALAGSDVEYKDLKTLSDDEAFQGSAMQEWASLAYADRQLRRAADLYLINRDESLQKLQDVWGVYEQWSTGASEPELRNRALLGLARVYEMQDKLEDARAAYGKIDGALAVLATERIKQLDSVDAKSAIEWLATVKLPNLTRPGGPGTPGERPEFNVDSPTADMQAPTGLDTNRSLDEILGGLSDGDDDDDGRYSDEDQSTSGAESVVDGVQDAEDSEEEVAEPQNENGENGDGEVEAAADVTGDSAGDGADSQP